MGATVSPFCQRQSSISLTTVVFVMVYLGEFHRSKRPLLSRLINQPESITSSSPTTAPSPSAASPVPMTSTPGAISITCMIGPTAIRLQALSQIHSFQEPQTKDAKLYTSCSLPPFVAVPLPRPPVACDGGPDWAESYTFCTDSSSCCDGNACGADTQSRLDMGMGQCAPCGTTSFGRAWVFTPDSACPEGAAVAHLHNAS